LFRESLGGALGYQGVFIGCILCRKGLKLS
jgi:hypothetical protein